MNAPPLEAIMLELHDLAMLLAPRGWRRAELFLPSVPDGAEPADVEVRADRMPAESERPVSAWLGVSEEHAVATLREAFADLRNVLATRSVSCDAGRIAVSRVGSDGCALEVLGSGREILFRHELAGGVRESIVYSDELTDEVIERAQSIDTLRDELCAQWTGHDDWRFDAASARLELARGQLPWRVHEAAVLGTYAYESETWLWAWANDELGPRSSEFARGVRDHAAKLTGQGAFLRAALPCDEPFAARLAWLAALRSGARGVYSAEYGMGSIYFAIEPGARSRALATGES